MKSLKRIMFMVLAIAILVIIPMSVYADTPISNETSTTTTEPVWCWEGGSKHVTPTGIGWYSSYNEARDAALKYLSEHKEYTNWEVQECDCGKFTAYVTSNKPSNPHTHTWDSGTITTPETCTTKGVITYHCIECDETLIGSIAEKGHSYNTMVVNPTCIENGYTKYICDNCGDAYISDYVNALNHNYRFVANNDGTHQKVCNNCDFATIENCSKAIEGDYEVCTVCNAKYEIPKPTDPSTPHTHTWDNGTITTLATCTTKGVITYHCNGCDDVRVENIDEIGHSYKYVANNDGTHQKVCDNCDFAVEENCTKNKEGDYEVCAVCNAKYEITKPIKPSEPSSEPSTEPTSPIEPSTEEKPIEEIENDNLRIDKEISNPYTGDTNRIGMYITMAAILIVGITAIILVGKLNKKKNK